MQYLDGIKGLYTIAMVDVDHFKTFNDKHGHDVGDQVLQLVASRLARSPGGGRAYRYGGEEFTLIFPGRTREQALPHLTPKLFYIRLVISKAHKHLTAMAPRKSNPSVYCPSVVFNRKQAGILHSRTCQNSIPEVCSACI